MKSKILLVLIISACLYACNSTHEQGTAKTSVNDSLQTATLYECPMKCEGKTYDKMGKCTVCGMDLVEKK